MSQFDNLVRIGIDMSNGKDKVVLPLKWNEITNSIYNGEENFMVLTGIINDIIVIDLDKKDDNFVGFEWFEKHFGDIHKTNTLVTRSLNGGYHVFFKYHSNFSKKKQNVGGLHMDILSNGCGCYQGLGYDIVCNDVIRDLNEHEIECLNKITKKEIRKSANYNALKEVLTTIPISEDYDTWRNVGFSLVDFCKHGEITFAEGRQLFDFYSTRNMDKYDPQHLNNQWSDWVHRDYDGEPVPKDYILDMFKRINNERYEALFVENKIREEVGRYIETNYNDNPTDVVLHRGDNRIIDGTVQNELLRRLVGCSCGNARHQIDEAGYCIVCTQCGQTFPRNNRIIIPSEYQHINRFLNVNINNLNIINVHAAEDELISLMDLSETFAEDPQLNAKYVEYVRYKNTENLLDIIQYIIGDDKKYIYSANNYWYEWHDDKCRWSKKEAVNMNAEYRRVKADFSTIENEMTRQNKSKKLILRIHRLIEDLGNNMTRENVLKMWKTEYMDETVDETMNSNMKLIGLGDGVYDLCQNVFRQGERNDYLTMALNVRYADPVDETKMSLVKGFFLDILPNVEIREYFLKVLGTCLSGKLLQNIFILEGYGKNGKSVLCGLLKEMFGPYYEQPRPTIVTRRAENANESNSAIMKLKSKRIVLIPEPSSKEPLQIDKLKAWTGGERISSREHYRAETDFQPQFKVFIMCNKKPTLSDNDGGIKRRLKIIKFPSLFVDNPVRENEKKMDEGILDKLKQCKREFFELLVHYWKDYQVNGLTEPEDVNELAKEYLDDNKDDILLEFIENNIEKQDDAVLTKTDVKTLFRQLYGKKINIDDFEKEIMEKYNIEYKKSKTNTINYRGWLGLKFLEN